MTTRRFDSLLELCLVSLPLKMTQAESENIELFFIYYFACILLENYTVYFQLRKWLNDIVVYYMITRNVISLPTNNLHTSLAYYTFSVECNICRNP